MPHASAPACRTVLTLLIGLSGLGLTAAAPASGGTINSNLLIAPGETFALGGGQEGGFTVTGRNTGPVALEVLAKAEGAAALRPRGTVAPGSTLKADFGPGEMALLRNTSNTRGAKLKLRISGDTAALGMSYSANP